MTMLGTGSFFRFTFQHPKSGGDQRSFSIAYKPPGPMKTGAVQELVLDVCRGPNLPDAVILLGVKEDATGRLWETLDSDAVAIARQRIAGRIPLIYAALSIRSGSVETKVLDRAFRGQKPAIQKILKGDVSKWMKAGLEAAFPVADVVLTAPPGYAYQKPSGARATIFLKPDLALKSSAAVGFVSLALFHRLYSGRLTRLSELQTVFVDTMAISPIAYGLRELMALCDHVKPFAIESFHSYGGFDAVIRPLDGTSLCLISASSSMSLHKRWIVEKQVSPEEVVTLVTIEPVKQFSDGALLAMSDLGDTDADRGPAQLSIRIKGETFLPEHEKGKKVLIRETSHRCDAEVKWFREFAGQGVFDVYRRPPLASSKPRALFVDGLALLKQQEFEGWLKGQLFRRVMASTCLVVHQEDEASRQLAGMVKRFCEETLKLLNIEVVALGALSLKTMAADAGVIVCGAVVGKGSQLLEVSRTLRDKHTGARLYIMGFQVTETLDELATLPANLRHDKSVPHGIARFGAAAVGSPMLVSFNEEVKMFHSNGLDLSDLPGALGNRARLLGETRPVGGHGLLPHGKDAKDQMRLREGFAFWKEGYVAGPLHAEALATIAVVLQRARESKDVPDVDRLATTTYRHVALDPENFARFNDGLLQGALLRCAYPSELDYRADLAASDFIKGVILRALRRATEEAGEGVLEFLAALSTRRLQVAASHLEEIVSFARGPNGRPAVLQTAIEHILSPLTGMLTGAKVSPI